METGIILHQMIRLFIMIFLGYLLFKVKLMDRDFIKKLTKLLLNVTLPATIFASVLDVGSDRDPAIVGEIFLIGIAIYLILPVLSFIVVKLLRLPKEDQGVYAFMTTYSNVGFMGFPLMDALYGQTAVFYAAIINILFNISAYTCGVIMINAGHNDGKNQFNLRKLISPGISISALAIVVYLFNIRIPADIGSAAASVGAITTPLAMIIIGATLATMEISEIFNDWRVYLYSAVKQIVLPLLFWPVLKLCISDSFILNVIFILILMPVANSSVLFATEYGRNERLAAKTIFITTVMSIVTVPLLLMICGGSGA